EILDDRLLRLVVGGQGSVDDAARRVEPALPVGLHDEGIVARERLDPGSSGGRAIAGRAVLDEVGSIGARPLALRRVPVDELLALRPRLAVRIGGGAIVEDAAVVRPRPGPLLRHPVLLASRLAPRRLVHSVLAAAALDPAARGCGAGFLSPP